MLIIVTTIISSTRPIPAVDRGMLSPRSERLDFGRTVTTTFLSRPGF
jgi:hypothetical protein